MPESVLRVGCAMWANRAWVGTALPSATAGGDELAAYSKVVNSVEGNTTFYALPSVDTAIKWARSVPSSFRFMFKLPKQITHERRLRQCESELRTFFHALEPLFSLMEPTSIQLPASFAPADLEVLDAFLRQLPADFRWAVEVRHPAFFGTDHDRAVNDLLHSHGADRIILDSRPVFAGPRVTPAEHDAFASKPRVPVRAVATADRPVVRFIGQTEADANPAFWEPWVPTVARWIDAGRIPTFFVHTPDNLVAPELARRFHAAVAELVPGLTPLPDAPTAANPELFP
ncbi:MAG: DUF72 domain-containing protein [Acidimicrobiales bacterium]